MGSMSIDGSGAGFRPAARTEPLRWRPGGGLMFVLIVLGATCGIVGGCGGTDAAPSDPFAGSWSGVVDDTTSGRGTLQITLSNDARRSGSWALSIGGAAAAGNLAPVPSAGGGPERQFTMTCGAPPAGGAALLTASVDGGALQGTYFAVGCPNLSRGSTRLAKR